MSRIKYCWHEKHIDRYKRKYAKNLIPRLFPVSHSDFNKIYEVILPAFVLPQSRDLCFLTSWFNLECINLSYCEAFENVSYTWCTLALSLIGVGSLAKNKKIVTAKTIIIKPRTVNGSSQFFSTKWPAIKVPNMLPNDVCEFHTPNIKPVNEEKKTSIR